MAHKHSPIVLAPIAVGCLASAFVAGIWGEIEPSRASRSWDDFVLWMGIAVLAPVVNSVIGVRVERRRLSLVWLLPVSLVPAVVVVATGGIRWPWAILLMVSVIPMACTWIAGAIGWWLSSQLQSASRTST